MKLFWSSFNFMNEIIQISLNFASLVCSVFSSLKDSEDLPVLTHETLLPSHSLEPTAEGSECALLLGPSLHSQILFCFRNY